MARVACLLSLRAPRQAEFPPASSRGRGAGRRSPHLRASPGTRSRRSDHVDSAGPAAARSASGLIRVSTAGPVRAPASGAASELLTGRGPERGEIDIGGDRLGVAGPGRLADPPQGPPGRAEPPARGEQDDEGGGGAREGRPLRIEGSPFVAICSDSRRSLAIIGAGNGRFTPFFSKKGQKWRSRLHIRPTKRKVPGHRCPGTVAALARRPP
jgi:hypothetical protein